MIIGLGLIQDDGAGAIIDNHQFGPVDRLAGDYRAGRHDPDLASRTRLSSVNDWASGATTLYWLNVGLGIVVFGGWSFGLSDAIAHVLHNPDRAVNQNVVAGVHRILTGSSSARWMQKSWSSIRSA